MTTRNNSKEEPFFRAESKEEEDAEGFLYIRFSQTQEEKRHANIFYPSYLISISYNVKKK